MAEILTESFCERCGSRYTFEQASKRDRLRGLKVASRGFRNFVLDDKTSFDEAMAAARSDAERDQTASQLDAFHSTFNFCMQCRQYTCPNCWNEAEGRCLTCAPLAVASISTPAVPDVDLSRLDAWASGASAGPGATASADASINGGFGSFADAVADSANAANGNGAHHPSEPFDPAAFDPAAMGPSEVGADVAAADGTPPADEDGIDFIARLDAMTMAPAPAPAVEPVAPATAAAVPAPAVEPEPVAEAEAAAAEWAVTADVTTSAPAPVEAVVEALEPAASPVPESIVTPDVTDAAQAPIEAAADIAPAETVTPDVTAAEAEAPAAAEAEAPVAAEVEAPVAAEATTVEPLDAITYDAPAEPETVELAPEPAPAPTPEPAAAPAPAPTTPPIDVVEQPVWSIVAPDPALPAAPVPPTQPSAPAPQWPSVPQWPTDRPQLSNSPGLPSLGRPAVPTGGVDALWAASAQEVNGARSAAPATTGVRPCVSCGLSLSANARFCRRCGNQQGV